MTETIVFNATTNHQGRQLTQGTPDVPGSCYLVTAEVAAFFVDQTGWANRCNVEGAVDATDLTIDPGTIRHADGVVLKPADILSAN